MLPIAVGLLANTSASSLALKLPVIAIDPVAKVEESESATTIRSSIGTEAPPPVKVVTPLLVVTTGGASVEAATTTIVLAVFHA
jgi:hypothetical protein